MAAQPASTFDSRRCTIVVLEGPVVITTLMRALMPSHDMVPKTWTDLQMEGAEHSSSVAEHFAMKPSLETDSKQLLSPMELAVKEYRMLEGRNEDDAAVEQPTISPLYE